MSQVLDGKRLSGVDLYLRHVECLRLVAQGKGTDHLIPVDAEATVRRMWAECNERVAAKSSPFASALDTMYRELSAPAPSESGPTASVAAAAVDDGDLDFTGPWGETPAELATATTMADIIAALGRLKARNGFDLTNENRRRRRIGGDLTPQMIADVLAGTVRPTANRVMQIAGACGDDNGEAWERACERVTVAGPAGEPAESKGSERFRYYGDHVVLQHAPATADLASRWRIDLVPVVDPGRVAAHPKVETKEGEPASRGRFLRRGAHRRS